MSNDKFVIEDTILKEVNKRLRKVEIPEGVSKTVHHLNLLLFLIA